MEDPPPIRPLAYFRPSPQKLKYVEDTEARNWRYRRIGFRLALFVLFFLIAFCFGPNLINFTRLRRPVPDDFIPIVARDCVPTVRAIKEYQRDHGHFPKQLDDLVPAYLNKVPSATAVESGTFSHYTMWNHEITYDFTPENEHWNISGPFANGRISAPPVPIGPSSRPSTQPY